MKKLSSILIIPDTHCHPNYDNNRVKYLAKYIVETRPDAIINIGDWYDMPSLSSFDKGKMSYEGRAYQDDIKAGLNGLDILANAIENCKGYKPELDVTLGNHEYRVVRAVEEAPQFRGKVSLKDLGFEAHGWKVHPFLQPIIKQGISFAHYHVSGVMGRAIGGENIGKTMCNKMHMSGVQGHSHIYDHSERAKADGLRMFGLSCGCYTHPEMIEDWNRSFVAMWWRGIVELIDLDGQGYYDQIRTTTLRKLTRDFK